MKARVARDNTGPAAPARAAASKARAVQARSRGSALEEGESRIQEDLAAGKTGPQFAFGDVKVTPAGQAGSPGPGGSPLPAPLRRKMESAFGVDFSDVRVHQGPEAGALSALAFTQGRDLHFAPGQYNPATPQGQKIIAHELAHVVQQRQGRVAVPTTGEVPLNADPSLEAEADALGGRAVLGEAVSQPQSERPPAASRTSTVGTPVQGMLARSARLATSGARAPIHTGRFAGGRTFTRNRDLLLPPPATTSGTPTPLLPAPRSVPLLPPPATASATPTSTVSDVPGPSVPTSGGWSSRILDMLSGAISAIGGVDDDPLQADFETIGRLTDLAEESGMTPEQREELFRRNGFGS